MAGSSWTVSAHVALLLLAAAASLPAGCAAPGAHVAFGSVVEVWPARGRVVRPLDYYRTGQERLDAFTGSLVPAPGELGLNELVRRFEHRSVRLEARTDGDERIFVGSLGSGILVGGRLVLAAAHSIPVPGATGLRVTMSDGRSLPARVLALEHDAHAPRPRDWALLELEGEPGAALEPLELGEAREGELVLILGYPGANVGRDHEGVVCATLNRPAAQQAALLPLAHVARVARGEAPEFVPLAGALITEGVSGGPILDTRGRLVSLVSGVATEFERGGLVHLIQGSSLDGLRDRLSAPAGAGGH